MVTSRTGRTPEQAGAEEAGADRKPPRHLLGELGFATRLVGEDLHGTAPITPQMHVPGVPRLRTSILATWADTMTGLLATRVTAPGVPVTLALDVHLYRPAPAAGTVRAVARTIRAGRSVFVAGVRFATDDGEPLAIANGSFMVARDPALKLPSTVSTDLPAQRERLVEPFAERAGCERRGPGTAVLPRSEDGLNASRTINGGLIALVAEEAVLSLAPGGTLCSMGLRYLQPARVGPVVATAHLSHGLGEVELRDSGGDDRLTGITTVRVAHG